LNGLREDVEALNEFIAALDAASDHLDIKEPFYQIALSAYQRLDVANVCESAPVRINDCLEGIQRIENIVDAMRVLSNRTVSAHSVADINSELEQTINQVRRQLPEGAKLDVSLLPLAPMLCHPGQIAQVVMHMLMNACHALRGEPGTISLSEKHEGNQLLIHISDSGCGMPEYVRQRAFDPFFTTRAEGEGTGIGLALCYKLIREHGGCIELESEEGAGTCFTLKLPIRQGEDNHA
ncbi:MAG: ATP-binding protein, partial [Thalassolituus sp.]